MYRRRLQMISLERRTLKKEAALQLARTDRTTPLSPPHTRRGMGRLIYCNLIYCNLSYLQNSMEIASCDLTHIFSLKAILQVVFHFESFACQSATAGRVRHFQGL